MVFANHSNIFKVSCKYNYTWDEFFTRQVQEVYEALEIQKDDPITLDDSECSVWLRKWMGPLS